MLNFNPHRLYLYMQKRLAKPDTPLTATQTVFAREGISLPLSHG